MEQSFDFSVAFAPCWVAEPQLYAPGIRGTVYLDTSIASYLTSRLSRDPLVRRRQRITRVWWGRQRYHFSILTSNIALKEASDGDPHWAKLRVNILSVLPVLTTTHEVRELGRSLIKAAALPANAATDADHVAIAAVNKVDFLLTWNCRHLANENAARHIVRTCEAAGFRTPHICTPEYLMRIFAHERSHS